MSDEAEVIKMPNSGTAFEFPSGARIQVDVIGTAEAFRDLGERVKESAGDHYQFLDKIISYIQEKHGATINKDEADWLDAQLAIVFAKKKQKQLKDLSDMQLSPNSMDLPPLD